MPRFFLPAVFVLACGALAAAAPISEEDARGTGILVLDDCDDKYKDKESYQDNLTKFGRYGKQMFRVTGFNNCESIGSSHMIAADPVRKCAWVIENVARQIRRFDLAGKETQCIQQVRGSAIAVNPETGDLWSLTNNGAIVGARHRRVQPGRQSDCQIRRGRLGHCLRPAGQGDVGRRKGPDEDQHEVRRGRVEAADRRVVRVKR